MRGWKTWDGGGAGCCRVLQCVAVCCRVLQCVVVCFHHAGMEDVRWGCGELQ